jgi:hypothetical protein
MKVFLLLLLLFALQIEAVPDACGVEGGNNCTCLTFSSQSFTNVTCEPSVINVVPSGANVQYIPGSCGSIAWTLSAGLLPVGLSLNPVSGVLSGSISVNGMPGFPLTGNPLSLAVLGTLVSHNFTVVYTFTFNDVCACLSYNDGNACNGVETCNPFDGQEIPGTSLNCTSSTPSDLCILAWCDPVSGCHQGPYPQIGQACYSGPNNTAGVGVCKSGVYACNPNTTQGLYCDGQVLPLATEDCGAFGYGNGLDDNCNGLVDEGCNGASCLVDLDCLPYRHDDRNCNSARCDIARHLCVFFPLPVNTSCPDSGNPCYATAGSVCDGNGACVGTALNTTLCDDKNGCPMDVCVSQLSYTGKTPFVYTPAQCSHTLPVNTTCYPCTVTSDCYAQAAPGACLAWNCSLTPQGGICTRIVNDTNLVGCDDKNICNGLETCALGVCLPGANSTIPNCDDGNVCSIDTCDPVLACKHNTVAAAGLACNDTTNKCRVNGACNVLGQCVGVFSVDCSPINECFLPGLCNASTGACAFTGYSPNGTLCASSNKCVLQAQCFLGACVPVLWKTCAPKNDCELAGVCNSTSGECMNAFAPAGSACNSGLYCTQNTTCDGNGTCANGVPRNCSSLDKQCVIGKCNEQGVFCYAGVRTPTGGACNADSSVCTVNDTCVYGLCTPGPPMVCASTNPCMRASCDPVLGCLFVPDDTLSCASMGTYCAMNPRCMNGTCVTTPRQCNLTVAGNVCKNSTCSDVFGRCVEVNLYEGVVPPGPGDGIVCNGQERCVGGNLVPGTPLVCTSLSPCRVGKCVEPLGCVYNFTNAVCQDGDPCTINDRCWNGTCLGMNQKDCSYLNSVCALGFCNTTNHGACMVMPINEGVVCDTNTNITNNSTQMDPSKCILAAGPKVCVQGVCTGNTTIQVLDCDDRDLCTTDICDPILLTCSNIGPHADACGVCGGTTMDVALCRVDYSHWDFSPLIVITGVMVFATATLAFVFCITRYARSNVYYPGLTKRLV